MPKFKSVVTKPREELGNGRVRDAQVMLIPLDDAAKVHPLAKDALEANVWKGEQKDIDDARRRLAAAEAKENKRRGIVVSEK